MKASAVLARLKAGTALPVSVILVLVLVVWYAATIWLNLDIVRDAFDREEQEYTTSELIWGTMDAERPLLPAPHQIVSEFVDGVFGYAPDSPRSLIYHGWVTLSTALTGLAAGLAFGIVLAILIVHSRTLEKSLMPWIISSQMVPILAIAPITIVVLGSIGIRGLIPKALISAYLCFFPIVIGMVKGLNSADKLQRDLMQTWSASRWEILWKLRWQAATRYLFASLKVAMTIAIVGAVVGELPTGAQAGIGARLLAGSYYGQTVQIWAALLAVSIIAAGLVAAINLIERVAIRRMGGRI